MERIDELTTGGDAASNVRMAIEKGYKISFTYEGKRRSVEPFTMGMHRSSGNRVMVAWLKSGWSESGKPWRWRMYRLDKMSNAKVEKMSFRPGRPGYNPPDSRLSSKDADMAQHWQIKQGKQKIDPAKTDASKPQTKVYPSDSRQSADYKAGVPAPAKKPLEQPKPVPRLRADDDNDPEGDEDEDTN